MDQALSPQVDTPKPKTEEAPAATTGGQQPYGNAAEQERAPPPGGGDPGANTGLANYKATLGEFLGEKLYKAVSDALGYDKVSGYAKSAVDGAISSAVGQLGGWEKIKSDPAALDALVTMLQQNLEPLVESWLASEDGRALVARLQNWAGAHPKTVVTTALLAAAGAVLANVDVPSLKSSFKVNDRLSAEAEVDLGRIRDLTLQKLRGKLKYQSDNLLAAIEVTRGEDGAVTGGVDVELKGENKSLALNGLFDGDGLKVAGLKGVLGLQPGMDLSGGLSAERGRDGVLSTLQLVSKDGTLTHTRDFSFDSGTGTLTLGQSILQDLGHGLTFRQSQKGATDGTGSQGIGISLTRDDLKAELDAAFSTTGTSISAKADKKTPSGYTYGGNFTLKDDKLLEVGTYFGFKDPNEFRGWLASYRHKGDVSEDQFKLTLENKLGDIYVRMSGQYTQGLTGGQLDASAHAGKFVNDNTALVGGLNYQNNFGTGKQNITPELGVQYKGVQVLFGYDAQNKAGTIRLGIPF